MRNLITIGKWSVCLAAAGVAACSSGTPANDSAGNANVAAATEAETGTGNGTEVNQTAPAVDGNMTAATPGNVAAGAAPAAGPAAYGASGTEPFWSLTLGSQMVYHPADGPDITVATPNSSPTRAGPMYVTPQMTVRINQFQRCTEASGKKLHDTVTITIGTQKLSGCGEGTPP